MEINDSKKGDVLILELVGRLDAATCNKLQEKITSLINVGERTFLVDCYRLEYISSAGLRVFYRSANDLAPSGGRIAFCALHPSVKNVFDVVDMVADFSIFAGREEAIRNLTSPSQGPSQGV